ncbi:MAG: LD-carboxypeptidase [Polyangiaceae bacterium]|nr:LD-carboxypeptidase [Polyangiaceae bacterium]
MQFARGLTIPPAVRPGDLVCVVAPSSPFEHALGWRGLGFLRERYRLRFDRGIFSRRGYLAGDDARRRDELAAAIADPDVRAIIAARGGYGASRYCHELAWDRLAADPKWIVGFSDVTALHVEAARVGVASLHAPHLTALGRADARGRAAWIDAVEEPTRPRRFDGLEPIAKGHVEGPLVGGNLTLLHACAASGRLVLPEGAILFLEDVGERPYRIDRMLTTLMAGGHLRAVRGIVLGDFTDCHTGADGVRIDDVLTERLASLGIPLAAGLPAGHAHRNEPLVLGAVAELDVAGSARLVMHRDRV